MLVAMLLGAVFACSPKQAKLIDSADDNETTFKSLLQTATGQCLATNPSLAKPIADLSAKLLVLISAEEINSAELTAVYLRQRLDYGKLPAHRAMAIDKILATLMQEISRKINVKTSLQDTLMIGVGHIREAALLGSKGATALVRDGPEIGSLDEAQDNISPALCEIGGALSIRSSEPCKIT
jgi:hypothetical protein